MTMRDAVAFIAALLIGAGMTAAVRGASLAADVPAVSPEPVQVDPATKPVEDSAPKADSEPMDHSKMDHGKMGHSKPDKQVWICPMECVESDKPGDCPECGMKMKLKEESP